ncbi:MAG: class I SAM-dependent methyltransferase [Pirellulales bacterium]|nr:class I SAM-dependent methyltransferase [Pirellulales bacterium]
MYHLPSYYDTLNTPGTAEDIDLYCKIARRYGRAPNAWLEPACGTGRHLRVLAGRGFSACGFDLDPDMINYAKESLKTRGLRAHVFRAGMNDFIGPIRKRQFDIAINPHSSFRHLLDERDAISHLDQMATSLAPGGIYIVGVSLARYGLDKDESDLWLAVRGRRHIRQEITYKKPNRTKRIEEVHSRLTISRPQRVETHSDSYRLQTYDRTQWDRLLSRCRLRRVATLDEEGSEVSASHQPYQLEVLVSN